MNDTNFVRRHSVVSYFVLTFLISWGGLSILIGPLEIPGLIMAQTTGSSSPLFVSVVLVTLTGPIIAGILMMILVFGKQGLRDMVSSWFKWRISARWYAVAILTAPLTVFGTLIVLSVFSPVFIPGVATASDKISIVTFAFAVALVGPFCEEMGWTGFAIPQMAKRYSVLVTGLVVGLLWGAWHFLSNLWGVGLSSGPVPPTLYMAALLFSFLPPFRVLMVWVYDHTTSLFIAYIMHFSLDFFWLISTPTGIAGVNLVTWYIAWAAVLWVISGIVVLGRKT
jgi:membrane protease YdiL (CAAX protease family)